MSFWIKHEEDPYIPDWLKGKLSSKCNICGSPMLNYYNDDMRCTNRKCSNDGCYGFVAAKADFARKIINLEGVGYARCLADAKMANAHTPFELIAAWGIKPIVSIEQFLRMHCFEGVDSEWERITKQLNIYTLDELYERYDGKWKQLLIDNKELIYHNAGYVTLKDRPDDIVKSGPRRVFNVMITGTPIGYETKEHFINTINEACRGLIVVTHQKTKRQSGVDCLIREPGSTTRGKVEAAIKGNIPILTSEEFVGALTVLLQGMNTEEEKQE